MTNTPQKVRERLAVLKREVDRDREYPEFESSMKDVYLLTGLPKKVWLDAYHIAWEAGHASGYSEVINELYDVLDLAFLAYEEGMKVNAPSRK